MLTKKTLPNKFKMKICKLSIAFPDLPLSNSIKSKSRLISHSWYSSGRSSNRKIYIKSAISKVTGWWVTKTLPVGTLMVACPVYNSWSWRVTSSLSIFPFSNWRQQFIIAFPVSRHSVLLAEDKGKFHSGDPNYFLNTILSLKSFKITIQEIKVAADSNVPIDFLFPNYLFSCLMFVQTIGRNWGWADCA